MTRKAVVLPLAAAFVLLVVWYLLLWAPKGREMQDASDRRAAAEAQAEQLELQLARLRATQERSPALTATLGRLKAAVPDTPQLAEFILEANAAADAAGVEFLSISPTPPAATDAAAPSSIGVGLSMEGKYFSLLDFFDRVLSLPRVVVFDSVQITPVGEGEDADLAVSLNGRMFTAQLPVVPGGADPSGAPAPAPAPTATTVPPPAALAAPANPSAEVR